MADIPAYKTNSIKGETFILYNVYKFLLLFLLLLKAKSSPQGGLFAFSLLFAL